MRVNLKHDIEPYRRRACARVDREAEMAREAFRTSGAGQAEEYAATLLEAQALNDLRRASLPVEQPDFPMLSAEFRALSTVGQHTNLFEVADVVLKNARAGNAYLARIKEVRRTAKLQVRKSNNMQEIDAIVAHISWPDPTAV